MTWVEYTPLCKFFFFFMLLLFFPAAAFVYSSKQNFYFPHTPRYGVHTYLRRRQFFFMRRGEEKRITREKRKGGEGRGERQMHNGNTQPSPLPRNSSSEDRLSHLLFPPVFRLSPPPPPLCLHTHTHTC